MVSRKLIWDANHWRFRAEEARTVADQMTHEEARTIMRRALPTTTTILLRLPRSNWPLRKEEQLAIDASTGWCRCPTAYQINLFPPQIVA